MAKRGALAALTGCLLATGPFLFVSPVAAQGVQDASQADDQAAPTPGQEERGALVQPFRLGGGAGLSEYYDSNPGGTAKGSSEAVTQGQVEFNAHDQTARFRGDVSYSLTGTFHPSNSALNSVQNYLNALGVAELLQDRLYLNARAFAWPTFLSRLGALDAGGGSSATANSRNAYGYTASPDLVFHFDDFARSDLSFTQSGEFFADQSGAATGNVLPITGPTSAQVSSLNEKLTGGEAFGHLEWTINGTATNSAQKNFHQRERSGELDFNYHIDRTFGIIGNVGYRRYVSTPSLTRGLSGVIAMGGFSFQPDESITFVAKAGKQYNFTSYAGSFSWQITGPSAFVATLDDVVATPQSRLLLGLGGLSTQGGFFQLPGVTLPDQAQLTDLPPPGSGPVKVLPLDSLALDNAISRYRTLTANLIHKEARTTYVLTFYGTVRDYLLPLFALDTRQTIYGIGAGVDHHLMRDLTASAQLDYSVAHEFGGVDKIFSFNLRSDYYLSDAWSFYGSSNFIHRDARNSLAFVRGSVDDVQLGAGLHYRF